MSKLFKKAWKITVGSLEVSALDFTFKVSKTLKPEPNTCEIKIFGLNKDSRLTLAALKKATVKLEVGYENALSQIFLGEVRYAQSTTEGPEIVTTLSSGDSEKEMATARISASYGAKTPPATVLRAIVKTLGVGAGNLEQAVLTLQAKGVASLYAAGCVISGNAARELTDFCRSGQLEWSIQDGKLQILDLGKALDGKAVELSSDTGLIGSPTVDSKGIATATCLMIPELRPGVKVSFESEHLRGGYRVQTCDYTGDTDGDDWTTKITCKKY